MTESVLPTEPMRLRHRCSFWLNAEAEWVVETIDRLSRKAFTPGGGPRVRLVPMDYFDRVRQEQP